MSTGMVEANARLDESRFKLGFRAGLVWWLGRHQFLPHWFRSALGRVCCALEWHVESVWSRGVVAIMRQVAGAKYWDKPVDPNIAAMFNEGLYAFCGGE